MVRSATTGSLSLPAIQAAAKRRQVRFGDSVNVILIPTADEYKTAHFADALWWDADSYLDFKLSAIREIREIIAKRGAVDAKTAMKIMYQPRPEELHTQNSHHNIHQTSRH